MDSNRINWILNKIHLNPEQRVPADAIRKAIARTKALPPMPTSAIRIINLTADPQASVEALAEVIEQDPLLMAQIIRWASSSLYGYQGKITSVYDAICKVLGFNFVLDLALGLAILAPLNSPKSGVIGMQMFWIQALASTRLMKGLAKQLPMEISIDQNEIFLVALLHNIGFPLLGHLFIDDFYLLNNLSKANSALPIIEIETHAMGISHAQIGAWLMDDWGMPSVLVDVIQNHHNPDYRGAHYQLSLLTYINDHLLGLAGIGDAINQTCPETVWLELGLHAELGNEIFSGVQDEVEKIILTAKQLIV